MSFRSLLRRLQKEQFGTVREFAAAMEMNPTQISRGEPFDVRGCLRLARVTGAPLGEILRAAGKADIADALGALVHDLESTPTLSADRRQLLAYYETMEPDVREDFLNMGAHLADAATFDRTRRRRRRRKPLQGVA